MKIFIGIILFITSSMCNAAAVKWELENFVFDDGGTALGSFTFNTATNSYSNIDILTTMGSSYPGVHYEATAGAWGESYPGYNNVFTTSEASDFTNQPWFRISAPIYFDASPGFIANVNLFVSAESFCTNASCSSAANPHIRELTSGHLIASPVPLPSALWFFVSGLLGIGLKMKKQYRNAF